MVALVGVSVWITVCEENRIVVIYAAYESPALISNMDDFALTFKHDFESQGIVDRTIPCTASRLAARTICARRC